MRKAFKKIFAMAVAVTMVSTAMLTALPVSAVEPGLDIAVVNFDAKLGNGSEKENLEKIRSYASTATDDEIILFPEYSLTSTASEAVDVSNNTSVAEISDLADNTDKYIIFGSVIKESEKIYSAMIICDPEGNIDVYKKIHITDEQYKDGFSAGTLPYILKTSYGNFGIAMGNEFAESPEIGKYFYGKSCRMILVGQSYGYDASVPNSLTQAEYDLYTATYSYVRMYSRSVAVANLYTKYGSTQYFGESHICTGYQNGWVAGGNSSMSAPQPTSSGGIVSASISENSRDTSNGMESRRLNLLADWYGKLTDYEMPVYGEGSPYKDDVKVASVNFHPVWGDLDANVSEIKSLMSQASKDGVELLVFPEMALTAYSVVLPETYTDEMKEKFGNDYMQHALAQTVRGDKPSKIITDLQKLAESYGMYVVIGLPERDEVDPDTYWNSVAILGPNLRQSYRKVNLASPEPNWASFGTENQDGIFETNFGLVGVAICADIYNYQELQRTFAARGCRIVINCTAGAANNNTVENGGWQLTYQNRLESFMLRDDTFMITSNLVGYEGPELTGELKEKLKDAGYTQDDITSSWLAKQNPDLYNLIYEYDEETQKNKSLLNPRACVFPGASVCISLDPTTSTGTKVYGNTSSSASITPYENDLGPYLDTDSDGKSPYLNYTTDTFNKYYSADFDLSLATLSNFYSDNPYSYRPNLYYDWYSELFYDTYGKAVSEKTLADPSTMIMVTGNMPESSVISTSVKDTEGTTISGYEIESAKLYSVSLESVVTTDVMHTNSTNTAYGATDLPYTGNYAPALGEVSVTIPVLNSEKAILYADDITVEAADGIITATLPGYYALNNLTVVTYKKSAEPSSAPNESTSEPSTEPSDTTPAESTEQPEAPSNASPAEISDDSNTSIENSGKTNAVATGDNTTIVYILGALLLAAGTIIIANKKINEK